MKIVEYIEKNDIEGAIFDMDGTLTSSMSRWNELYRILFDYLGLKFNDEYIMRFNHLSMPQIVEIIIDGFSLNVDRTSVYEYWLDRVVNYYETEFKIKPYVLEVLHDLKRSDIKMCVATASDRACAEVFIKGNDLGKYFSSVTSLNEVERPKSFPDIYLKAAEKIGVSPCKCLVFEDALTAIKSAKSGGFKVCGVQDECSKRDEEEIKALSDITLGFDEQE